MSSSETLSRRLLLTGAAAAFISRGAVFSPARAAETRALFQLGVASGDPRPNSVVLWTRLAPEPLSEDPAQPGGMMPEPVPVRWEIAEDEAMSRVVQSGDTMADPAFAHSVHVEPGGLAPNRPYWYRFVAQGQSSPVARTRTAPAAGAPLDRLRFGFVSCSHFELGYFSAYRHLAAEQPDLVCFLGDYIYETIPNLPNKVRHHLGGVAADLAGYRLRYAQYKADPDLQAVHAGAPCLTTWDDHEVQNDYADRWAEDFTDPAMFLARRAAAYRAFWENMPLRRAALPQGPDALLYDRFAFGDLAEFSVLDGRQYRSRMACDRLPKGGGRLVDDATCPERLDPARSYLGAAQESWLHDGLAQSRSRWNIIAQDTLMAEFRQRRKDGAVGYWSDNWNGYPASRDRLLQRIEETRLANPVVIGGDIHSFWANDISRDTSDPRSPIIATEFVGTSITSNGPPYDTFMSWMPENPQVKFFDSRSRGYAAVDLGRDRMEVAFRIVSDVKQPAATLSTLKRFVVENGKAGAIEA